MDDFNAPDTFKKGRGKVIELKAWQSRQGDKISVSKFRCWDGLLGCEEYKASDSFKWHPRLCNLCTAAIATRYSAKQADVEMLTVLLSLDDGLFKSVRYLTAPADKVEGLERGKEIHIKRLMDTILSHGKDAAKVKATHKAYRDWFYDQAGIEIAKPKHAPGFTSVATALPVGDRT